MMAMLEFISATILLLLALVAITLQKTYYYLPEAELKRQAQRGNALAKVLYRAVAYGANLRLLLWLLIGLFAAFVIVGKWLSNKVSRKTTAVAKTPREGV